MRKINELVSELDGQYYVNVFGDEVLLNATNIEDATAEADEILCQADAYIIAMEIKTGYLRG